MVDRIISFLGSSAWGGVQGIIAIITLILYFIDKLLKEPKVQISTNSGMNSLEGFGYSSTYSRSSIYSSRSPKKQYLNLKSLIKGLTGGVIGGSLFGYVIAKTLLEPNLITGSMTIGSVCGLILGSWGGLLRAKYTGNSAMGGAFAGVFLGAVIGLLLGAFISYISGVVINWGTTRFQIEWSSLLPISVGGSILGSLFGVFIGAKEGALLDGLCESLLSFAMIGATIGFFIGAVGGGITGGISAIWYWAIRGIIGGVISVGILTLVVLVILFVVTLIDSMR